MHLYIYSLVTTQQQNIIKAEPQQAIQQINDSLICTLRQEVEGVEIEKEVKAFIKMDLPFVGDAKAILAEKKPNIEFRTEPFIKNAGRIDGGHTQPIQTPNTTTPSNPEQEEN